MYLVPMVLRTYYPFEAVACKWLLLWDWWGKQIFQGQGRRWGASNCLGSAQLAATSSPWPPMMVTQTLLVSPQIAACWDEAVWIANWCSTENWSGSWWASRQQALLSSENSEQFPWKWNSNLPKKKKKKKRIKYIMCLYFARIVLKALQTVSHSLHGI